MKKLDWICRWIFVLAVSWIIICTGHENIWMALLLSIPGHIVAFVCLMVVAWVEIQETEQREQSK